MRKTVKEILGVIELKTVVIKGVKITPLNKIAEHEMRHFVYEYQNENVDDDYVEKELKAIMNNTKNYRCVREED